MLPYSPTNTPVNQRIMCEAEEGEGSQLGDQGTIPRMPYPNPNPTRALDWEKGNTIGTSPDQEHMSIFTVLLPNGKQIRMGIDNRTPMMDVLVLVTTKNGISPGGKVLKVPTDRPPGYLHYKPNTPIGVLHCSTIEVVPKRQIVGDKPFVHTKMSTMTLEPSLRVQVDLPRKQKTVFRVPPRTLLSEILHRACEEGNLGPNDYELHGAKAGHGYPLKLDLQLTDVGTMEFVVVEVRRQSTPSEIFGSFSDAGGGVFRGKVERKKEGCFRSLFNRRKKRVPPPLSIPPSAPPVYPSGLNNGYAWSSSTLTSFQTFIPSEYEIPSEPSPPPPLPPCSINTKFKSKRPAPPPPSVLRHGNRTSESSSGYRSILQPSPISSVEYDEVRKMSGSDKSSPMFTFPSDCVRNGAPTSRPESMSIGGTDLQKKRRAPPPPPTQIAERQGQGSESQKTVSHVRSSPAIVQNASQPSLCLSAIAEKELPPSPSQEQGSQIGIILISNGNTLGCPKEPGVDEKSVGSQSRVTRPCSMIVQEENGKETGNKAHDQKSVPASTLTRKIRQRFDSVPPGQTDLGRTDRSFANATCQTDLLLGGSAVNLDCDRPVSPRSAIVCVEANGGQMYTPKTTVQCFEDEYYSKNDTTDYARTVHAQMGGKEPTKPSGRKVWQPQKDEKLNDKPVAKAPTSTVKSSSKWAGSVSSLRSQEYLNTLEKSMASKMGSTPKRGHSPTPVISVTSPKTDSRKTPQSIPIPSADAKKCSEKPQNRFLNVTLKKRGTDPGKAPEKRPDRESSIAISSVLIGNGTQKSPKVNGSKVPSPPPPPPPPVPLNKPPPPPSVKGTKQEPVMTKCVDGRSDLLAAIRGHGGIGKLKKVRNVA